MTRKQMGSYRSMKQEISEIQYALAHLGEGDSMLGSSVINDYRSGYPVPQTIVGVDWERLEAQKKHYKKESGVGANGLLLPLYGARQQPCPFAWEDICGSRDGGRPGWHRSGRRHSTDSRGG